MNKSTNSNCSNTNYSETACGFVVFFNKEVSSMQMRNTNTNVGGYPATLVYDYLKNTLYGQFPQDLQKAIKSTRVISGYGNNGTDSANFITNDKLYLLSGKELTEVSNGDQIGASTGRLDYYQSNEFSSSKDLWLRSANAIESETFNIIGGPGVLDNRIATASHVIVPAFRIG